SRWAGALPCSDRSALYRSRGIRGTTGRPGRGGAASGGVGFCIARTWPSRPPRSLMWICGLVRGWSSVVVGDQGALDGRAELPVEPDDGVEGEQALHDADPQPRGDAAAVPVQAELVFQRPDDRLHPLAQPGREATRVGFVLASGPQQGQLLVGQGDLDLVAGKPFVADQHGAWTGRLAGVS